jgi:hypothetical protein
MISFIGLNDVLLRSSDNGSDRKEKGTEEQAFALMGDRSLESPRELGKAEDHCASDAKEEDQVDDEEDSADCD